ncbi:MAG: hypothetical protein AMJ54_10765 [Deltaproteobacteria bacterium SG8_13]|nr:MAG: hypothetical protein AMJ54_10765 [Deltaproteobacteria bacterium SG8_13]
MVDLTGDISRRVYRQVLKNDAGDISVDGRLLGVFLQLDGKKELGAIARKAGLQLPEIRGAVSRLLDLGLIEAVERPEEFLDQDFLDYVSRQLAVAVGPIADVLVEDHISDSGFQFSQVPVSQAAVLVDALAREIQREEKMKVFKINMVKKMREKGY